MALDQLDGQARFTDTTTADNDELILSQELAGEAANVSYTEQAKAKGKRRGRTRGDKEKNARAERQVDQRTLVAEAIVKGTD